MNEAMCCEEPNINENDMIVARNYDNDMNTLPSSKPSREEVDI